MAEDVTGQGTSPQPRTIRWDDRDWVVLDGGRALTGHGHLEPARIRLIQFADATNPGVPLLEALAPPGPVDEMHDSELLDMIARARQVPVYGPPDESSRSGRRIRSGGAHGNDGTRGRR
jgi:hypothetical protein